MGTNAAPHATAGHSPNKILFGREVNLPVEYIAGPPPTHNTPSPEYVQKLRDNIKIVQEETREKQMKAKINEKKFYDKNLRYNNFAVGDKVWRAHITTPAENRRFAPKWDGPHTVTGINQNSDVYQLTDQKGKITNVHHNRLRKAYRQFYPALEKPRGTQPVTPDATVGEKEIAAPKPNREGGTPQKTPHRPSDSQPPGLRRSTRRRTRSTFYDASTGFRLLYSINSNNNNMKKQSKYSLITKDRAVRRLSDPLVWILKEGKTPVPFTKAIKKKTLQKLLRDRLHLLICSRTCKAKNLPWPEKTQQEQMSLKMVLARLPQMAKSMKWEPEQVKVRQLTADQTTVTLSSAQDYIPTPISALPKTDPEVQPLAGGPVSSGKGSTDTDEWEMMETEESMQELSALVPELESEEFWKTIFEEAERESQALSMELGRMGDTGC